MTCQVTTYAGEEGEGLEGFTIEIVATELLPDAQVKRRESLTRAWLVGNSNRQERVVENECRRRRERLRQQVARLQQELQTLEARR